MTKPIDPFDKVAGRLAAFVRLLSSDRDGEVLAAVHAMIRTLRSAGVDIHALAQRVEQKGGLTEAEMKKLFDAGRDQGYREAKAEIEAQEQDLRFHSVDAASTFHAMAVFCKQKYTGGNPKEQQFVEHMVQWTKRRDPTERQQLWLEDIYQRLGGT